MALCEQIAEFGGEALHLLLEWLTIIFLAVFAAMWIWFFVLLVQASGEVRSLGSSGPFDYEGSDEDYDGPVR